MQTLHIPAVMGDEVSAVTGRDFSDEVPLFVLSKSANPDEFEFAIYADKATLDSTQPNERANMLAEFCNTEGPVFGDVFLSTDDPEFAKKFLATDQAWQAKNETSKAFKAWLQQYATNTGQDVMEVFDAVAVYMACVVERAMVSRNEAMVAQIAEVLGVDASDIGVISL